MTVELDRNNCWKIQDGQVAVRLRAEDVSGWFSKDITIAQGTRAAVFDGKGNSLGVVNAGQYKLPDKNATVYLCIDNDIPFLVRYNVKTKESLPVQMEINLLVKVSSPDLLAKKMGNTPELTKEELCSKILKETLHQALENTAELMSIKEMSGDKATALMFAGLQKYAKLEPYGLEIVSVVSLSAYNEEYNALTEKDAELFLLEIEIEQQNCEITLHQKMREAVQSDEFNKLTTEAERETFILALNKDKLLKQNEMDSLVESIRNAKEDRELTRKYLLEILDIERKSELDLLRVNKEALQKKTELQQFLETADSEEEALKKKIKIAQLEKELFEIEEQKKI